MGNSLNPATAAAVAENAFLDSKTAAATTQLQQIKTKKLNSRARKNSDSQK